MAPNKRGGPLSAAAAAAALAQPPPLPSDGALLQTASVISAEEVAARGSGTREDRDSYDPQQLLASEARVWWTAWMFLTRLPAPSWVDHHPAYLMRSMQWFPLIGALVGAWGAVWLNAAAVLLPRSVAAGAAVLACEWLCGCFHADGLADCFDGFGGGWGKAQILRIMRDSRVGTYAVVGMSLVLHMKLHALAALPPGLAWRASVAAHCASRWSSVLVYTHTYIQSDEDAKQGLYNYYAQCRNLFTLPRLLVSTLTAVLVPAALLAPGQALLVCATVALVTAAAGAYGQAILGGVVGDYLGATIYVAEVAVYLVLLADWGAIADGGWRPLALLAGVVALPVAYCRRIVDFGAAQC